MNAEVKKKWIAALRFGDYKQGKYALCQVGDETGLFEQPEYCCLGVLCDLAAMEGIVKLTQRKIYGVENLLAFDGERSLLPSSVVLWANFEDSDPSIP